MKDLTAITCHNCDNLINLRRYVLYDKNIFCCEECVEEYKKTLEK